MIFPCFFNLSIDSTADLQNSRYSFTEYFNLGQDFFDASDFPAFQADLDTVRVGGGFRQDVFDHTLGQLSRPLIFFQDDQNLRPRFDVIATGAVHSFDIPSAHPPVNLTL